MNKTGRTIVLTFLVSVAAVAACGPTRTKVAIRPFSGDKKAEQFSCARPLGRYDVHVDSKTTTVDGKAPVIKICQADPEGDYTPYTRETLGAGARPVAHPVVYKAQTRDISYRVGKQNDIATIFLSIGVEFAEADGAPSDGSGAQPPRDVLSAERKVEMINRLCIRELHNSWQASRLGKINLRVTVDAFDASKEYDQILTLKGSEPEGGRVKRYIALSWPDRGQFIPQPKMPSGCSGACSTEVTKKANLRFCANLALVIGQWLGLKASEAQSETCQVPPEESATEPSGAAPAQFIQAESEMETAGEGDIALAFSSDGAKAGLRVVKSFMTSADPKSPDFWQNARFAKADLVSIMEPVCKGKVKTAPKDEVSPE